jgi:hypothetical protein
VLLDERFLPHPHIRRNPHNFFRLHLHHAGPPAAICAALAGIADGKWHSPAIFSPREEPSSVL